MARARHAGEDLNLNNIVSAQFGRRAYQRPGSDRMVGISSPEE